DRLAAADLLVAVGAAMTMTVAAAAGAMIGVGIGGALGALFLGDQRLSVGDRDLIIIGMDFRKGEEAVPVAAVIDEGRLQRRLDARDLGEIDVTAKLLAVGAFEVEFLDAVAAQDHDPGLLGVGRIDQHFVGHNKISLGKARPRARALSMAQDQAGSLPDCGCMDGARLHARRGPIMARSRARRDSGGPRFAVAALAA